MPQALVARHARRLVVEALQDTRVVFVMGARQGGKSTLTTVVAEQDHPARILTLDDRGTRAAALADPTGFVAGLDSAVVIDEVQRAPDLLPACCAPRWRTSLSAAQTNARRPCATPLPSSSGQTSLADASPR